MSYSAASDVAAYTPNLLDSGHDNFTATTRPTKSAVEHWLSAGCALIEGQLAQAGFTPPVSSDSYLYDYVKELETLYAAGRAEMARLTARVAVTERTRSQVFMDQFNNGLKLMMQMNLARAGISKASGGGLYIGGVSSSDKDGVEADSDREPTRFKKGMWRYSGTGRPSGIITDDESS